MSITTKSINQNSKTKLDIILKSQWTNRENKLMKSFRKGIMRGMSHIYFRTDQ